MNTRRHRSIFTSLLTLTFPSLSYCLLSVVPLVDEPKKQGGELRVPGENVRGKKNNSEVPVCNVCICTIDSPSNQLDNKNENHSSSERYGPRGCSACADIVVRVIQKSFANRIERRSVSFIQKGCRKKEARDRRLRKIVRLLEKMTLDQFSLHYSPSFSFYSLSISHPQFVTNVLAMNLPVTRICTHTSVKNDLAHCHRSTENGLK